MLFRRRNRHCDLCVLRVSPEVLDLPGVVVADGNAASKYTSFRPAPDGLAAVDKTLVFAERWTNGDQVETWEHSRVKCAEVLVPDQVPARYITGAYVSGPTGYSSLCAAGFVLPVSVDRHLFFVD